MPQMIYSIIVPAYNEAESLQPLWKVLEPVMKELRDNWELIFINDGSKDNSYEIMQGLQKKNKNISIIHFPRNAKKAAALQAGFNMAQGKYVITMDADLQDDPREIPKMLKKLEEGYDLVSGWKKDRHDPWHKTIPSFFFNGLIRLSSGLKLHDINCGLKMYRKEVIKNISIYGELYRFIPMLAANNGFRVTEVAVKHHPRKFGKSKYGISRFMRGFLDLITVIFLTKFIKRPLHFFGPLGILLLLLGIGIEIYLATIKFVYFQSIGDRPLLIFGVLLIIAGLQLVSTGLIAELITYYAHKTSGISAAPAAKIIEGAINARLEKDIPK